MANVVTRRLFNNSAIKFKSFSSFLPNNRCLGVFVHNLHQRDKFETNSSCRLVRVPQLSIYNQVQYFSIKNQQNGDQKKLSVFQRFKQMYKNYWYVLLPVHLVTSTFWLGGFYYMAKSGVDIVALLEYMHISEKIINPLKDSSMGYIAVAYALYKIATPIRYTVTLGGTTISINYLRKWGYIKPVPSPERLKEMVLEGKDNLIETMRETRHELKIQGEKFKDKKEDIMDDLDKGIKQIKKLGDKIKHKDRIVNGLKKDKKD